MHEPISVPLWLFVPIALFAAWSLLDRLLIPSGRWFVRRRLNRLIDQVNARLQVGIQPFQLTRRQVLIDRLIYDPQVVAAVNEHAKAENIPREAAMNQVHRYAHEIVPAFNAYIYFRIGYAISRGLARALFRVRLGYMDNEALLKVDPARSTVVFVMNHRSNMDYVLVSFMVADRTALSYAVGEWARIWPLQSLIKATGAYFVRRNSNNPLYRRVLERYVFMATEAGVAQAVYPEGGLSRDGKLRAPRLGLLDYMLKNFDPHGARDITFVPVGLNYDRTLEDRTLLLSADADAPKRSGWFALRTVLRFWGRNFWQMMLGRWRRFGYACVNFGTPVSARDFLAADGHPDLRKLDKEVRFGAIERLAGKLMADIGAIVPVLPVSLVATVALEAGEAGLEAGEFKQRCKELIDRLRAKHAHVYFPRGDDNYSVKSGLRMLTMRHLLEARDGRFMAVPKEEKVLRYYANSIAHLL